MKLPRRKFLHLAAGIAAVPATARIARAQAYPTGPVRLIVGFPAGGTNDVHARLIAEWLSKQFGRSFVVENRPGATGNIALEAVVRATPDGYMLSVCGSTELRNEIIYTDLKFSFMGDTTPIASIYRAPLVVVVHPSFSARSVPELIAAAKAMPDSITVASPGVGSAPHVSWELFRSMTGIRMLHVPYRGGRRRSPTCWGSRCRSTSPTSPRRRSTSKRADCARLRSPAQHAYQRCRMCPPLPSLYPAMSRSAGWALSPPRTRPRQSSVRSTRR
jgi:tripartite-type tricarboxylate transporter receptor subunit TctC